MMRVSGWSSTSSGGETLSEHDDGAYSAAGSSAVMSASPFQDCLGPGWVKSWLSLG